MVQKPLIVIDLDNVLAQSAQEFVNFSNQHFEAAITLEDYNEDWSKMWGVSYEEAERRGAVMREHDMHQTYNPMPDALEVLQGLQPKYRLVILTSRREVTKPATDAWLERHYPGIFDDVLFSGIWDGTDRSDGHLMTKGDQYKALGAAYVIDDHLKHCAAATQHDATGLLFGEYPWNRHDDLPAGVVYCSDWQAVGEYFNGRA